MMIITEIVTLDQRRSRVSVDGSFAFVLYKREIKKYDIELEKEISRECYDEILSDVIIHRAKARILYLLKASDRTEKQLYDKLKEGYYPKEAIEVAIAYAKSYHYIDDERYARNYIQFHGKKNSKKQLMYTLLQKGIGKELLENLLEENPVDEDIQIQKWLTKKHYNSENATYEEKQKLGAALVRKGFSVDNIKQRLGNSSIYD